MTSGGRALRLWTCLALLAMAGCAGRPAREVVDAGELLRARAELMRSWPIWSFEGRVAVRDGREGGSGRIRWREGDGRYEITLRAPVFATTWELAGDATRSELRGAGPRPVQGADPEELLARGTGWHLPVRHARAWVRGLALDPTHARVDESRDGLPAVLVENGWTVEFGQWASPGDGLPPMPQRIVARRAPWEVRLAISRWSLDRGG